MACITLECCEESPFSYESADISLLSGLDWYYQFEEATGSDRMDATGNGNTLTPSNAPTQAAGKIDFGVDCERSSRQFLTAASNSFTEVDGAFTVAGWVNFESLVTGSAVNENCIWSKYRRSGATTGVRLRYWHISHRIELVSVPVLGTEIILGSSFGIPNTATWYFLCAGYDATEGKYFLQVNDQVADVVSGAAPVDNGLPMLFADIYDHPSADVTFDGKLDEWGKWSRVLTLAERTFLYRLGNGITYPFNTP